MKYELKRPCKSCPFRSDKRFILRKERCRQIADLFRTSPGGTFACHNTTTTMDRGSDHEDAQHCAGALILAVKSDTWDSQMLRIADRLGFLSHLDLQSPVYESFDEFVEVVGEKN